MNRIILPTLLAAALLPGLAIADETTVYRKKNADGTTTYSQEPIAGAEATRVNGRDPSVPAAPEAAADEPSKTEQACANATANLALYESGKTLVKPAADGGDPVPMTPEELAAGREEAARHKLAFCSTPAE